jgi:hypothetical protein
VNGGIWYLAGLHQWQWACFLSPKATAVVLYDSAESIVNIIDFYLLDLKIHLVNHATVAQSVTTVNYGQRSPSISNFIWPILRF